MDIRYQNTLDRNHMVDGDAAAVVGSLPVPDNPAEGSLRDVDEAVVLVELGSLRDVDEVVVLVVGMETQTLT